jgi:hypothetical protein
MYIKKKQDIIHYRESLTENKSLRKEYKELSRLSTVFVSWRKFIYDKSACVIGCSDFDFFSHFEV